MAAKFYTVETRNKFAAFSDSENDDETERVLPKAPASVVEQEKSQRGGRGGTGGSPVARGGAAADRRPARGNREGGGRGEGGERGGRGGRGGRGRFGDRPPRDADNDARVADRTAVGEEEVRDDRRLGGNVGREGPFRARGGRGYRGGSGREFDRRSGTGRGREMKKLGGGAHNWGNDAQDFGGENAPAKLSSGELPPAESSKDAVESPNETAEVKREEQESTPASQEPEMIDFDSYRKMREARRANLPDFTGNRPAVKRTEEDAADLEKEGYQRYVKERVAPKIVSEGSTDDEEEEEEEVRPKKMNYFQLAEECGNRLPLLPHQAVRGGRGGRGRGPRGDRERKNPKESTKQIDIHDPLAFPKLGQ